MPSKQYLVPAYLDNYRIDKALSILCDDISRSQIQKAIKEQDVNLNGLIISNLSSKVKDNDLINLNIKPTQPKQVKPANLDIIYEDDDLLVINKSSNMTVHPGAGTKGDTLTEALLYQKKQLSNLGNSSYPGIVHRLDKNTSGLMVVAKNNHTHQHLAKQIEVRTFRREYTALIWGSLPKSEGVIDLNIDQAPLRPKKMTSFKNNLGKRAITYYEVLNIMHDGLFSLVKCKLDTGRTHQIRVHMSHTGHSLVGDQLYGNNVRKIKKSPLYLQEKLLSFTHQALHSSSLSFHHPNLQHILEFKQKLPDDYQQLLDMIDHSQINNVP